MSPRHPALGDAGGGPTDRAGLPPHERASGGGVGGEFPGLALRFPEHFGEVSRRGPRQVGGHLSLSPLLWLGATSRPPAPVPRPLCTEKAGMKESQAPTPVGLGSGG